MAHELEFVDGKAQMAYAGEVPWHGHGTPVDDDLTPEEMMKAAGLDWDVKKYSMFTEVKGKRVKADVKALVRSSDSKILTQVGPDWNPVQNSEAFEFFNDFVKAGDMSMHTAGSLKGGRHVWALARVNQSFELFGGDRVDSFMLFSNPHQYGKSLDVRFTPIRVVCNNTLTLSLGKHASLSYSAGHASPFNTTKALETLGVASEKFSKYREMAEFLGSRKYNPSTLVEYYSQVFPRTSGSKSIETYDDMSRNAKIAHDMLETQPGAEFASGTWWQAFNSVTFVTDHVQGRNAENRLYSNWFGSNQARKVNAANLAVKMAENA